jgi:hypothetical protein
VKSRLLPLPPYNEVVAQYEAKVLVRDGQRYYVYDADQGTEHEIGEQPQFQPIRGAGRFVYAEPFLIDLGEGRLLRQVTQDVLAISGDGRLLMREAAPASLEVSDATRTILRLGSDGPTGYKLLPWGPLRWVAQAP